MNLAFSLLFGIGQLVIGAAVVARMLSRGGWRVPRSILLLIIAAWFVMSGAVELVVSGMEVSHRVSGRPSAETFSLWRGRADTALAVYSASLLIALLALLLRSRINTPQKGPQS